MKGKWFFYCIALTTLVFVIGCKPVSEKSTTEANTADESVNAARDFAKAAANDGMLEIRLAEIAMDRSENPEIDSLALMIKTDHQKANDELHSLALNKRWILPATMMAEQEQKVQEIKNTADAQFDKTYLQTMVTAHKGAIAKFEEYAADGHDAELVAWVKKTLPVLQKHLDHSQTLLNSTASR